MTRRRVQNITRGAIIAKPEKIVRRISDGTLWRAGYPDVYFGEPGWYFLRIEPEPRWWWGWRWTQTGDVWEPEGPELFEVLRRSRVECLLKTIWPARRWRIGRLTL